jgi:DNA-directed RNA polymerase subunit RPC12/RpoP
MLKIALIEHERLASCTVLRCSRCRAELQERPGDPQSDSRRWVLVCRTCGSLLGEWDTEADREAALVAARS